MPSAAGPLARALSTALLLAALGAAGGCAVLWPQSTRLHADWPADLPAAVELTDVPFYPQRDYDCGPAALATVMAAAGARAELADLVTQVYVPERQGSLQTEMLAAPRRHGLLTYALAPRLEAVLREVAGGTPVVVMQNYGLGPFDRWHYAVVAGYDRRQQAIVLRSGERERLTVTFPVFELLWKKGRQWSMVAVAPRRVPLTAEEHRHREAVLALERVAPPAAAQTAYAAAVERWPDSVPARVALANAHYAAGELAAAVLHLEVAHAREPDAPVVLNNLAQALSDQGRHEEALTLAERALARESPFRATIEETRAGILDRLGRPPR